MNVFIIEDSPTLSLILAKTLGSYGYITYIFSSTAFNFSKIKCQRCDFFIINTNLDDRDSYSLCKNIRKKYENSYIIGINHKGSWKARLEILHRGADDCLTYPFPPEEILARMQVLLRRPRKSMNTKLEYGNLLMDPRKKEVHYSKKKIDLSKKEYHILEYLVRNSGRCISRSELFDHVWDYRKDNNSNTVDVHINRVRRKLGKVRNDSYINSEETIENEAVINTVHGIGYELKENIKD